MSPLSQSGPGAERQPGSEDQGRNAPADVRGDAPGEQNDIAQGYKRFRSQRRYSDEELKIRMLETRSKIEASTSMVVSSPRNPTEETRIRRKSCHRSFWGSLPMVDEHHYVPRLSRNAHEELQQNLLRSRQRSESQGAEKQKTGSLEEAEVAATDVVRPMLPALDEAGLLGRSPCDWEPLKGEECGDLEECWDFEVPAPLDSCPVIRDVLEDDLESVQSLWTDDACSLSLPLGYGNKKDTMISDASTECTELDAESTITDSEVLLKKAVPCEGSVMASPRIPINVVAVAWWKDKMPTSPLPSLEAEAEATPRRHPPCSRTVSWAGPQGFGTLPALSRVQVGSWKGLVPLWERASPRRNTES